MLTTRARELSPVPILLGCVLVSLTCNDGSHPGRRPSSPEELTRAALTVPSGFSSALLVRGLEDPTAMAFSPDGRLFVCEQGGALRVVSGGQVRPTPFLRVTVDNDGERGLLGVAFDPAFTSNRQLYVYYTSPTPVVHNRVSRFRASAADPNVVEAGSETVLMDLDPLSGATNHNGGALHFGPDGKLYVAVGDNARASNAQTLSNLHGKMLRLEPDGRIPADNPLLAQTSGANRAIWALGLRNPFTFAFDAPAAGGRMFINDVGQDTWEEIDLGVAGANYGWPTTEGPTSDSRFRAPVHAYGHSSGCSIAGGAFYRSGGGGFPADHQGDYFFADYCGGWVRRLDVASGTVSSFATGLADPVDVDVGSDGALYVLARGDGGRVERITAAVAGTPPFIARHPANVEVLAGQVATFSVEASGSAPLSYQWQRNGVVIPGATAAVLQLESVQPGDDGARFRVAVSSPFGRVVSAEATLSVSTDEPPQGAITAPEDGTLYRAGETLFFSAEGSDPEDGPLPGEAFTFWVDLHHDEHTHPAKLPVSGASSGSFLVPTEGEVSTNVFYRIHVEVRDSSGLAHHSSVDVHPLVANVTLDSEPVGLTLELDGTPVSAPHDFSAVVGMQRQLAAPGPQDHDGRRWVFSRWSDGGSAAHGVVIPEGDARWVAVYEPVPVTPPPASILEAENAVISGAQVSTLHSGYTGTGFVDYVRPTADFVEWTVRPPAPGPYTVELRYANYSSSLRPLDIRVNGILRRRVSFPPTPTWIDWRTIQFPVNLQGGVNRIRATATGASGPNMDHLRLLPR